MSHTHTHTHTYTHTHLKLLKLEAVGDDGLDALLEASHEHVGHLVPRLVHLSPIDALQGQACA